MADLVASTINRIGTVNSAVPANYTDATALFLKRWHGEIEAALFDRYILDTLVSTKPLPQGKSEQILHSGRMTASRRSPGEDARLNAQQLNKAESLVMVDYPLEAVEFCDNWDKLLAHYEFRSEVTDALADSIGSAWELILSQLIYKAARSTSPVTGEDGGTQISVANVDTDMDVMAAAFYTAAETLDTKNISEEGRHAVLKPAQYYQLVQKPEIQDIDYGGEQGLKDAKIKSIAGIMIHKSNVLTTANVAASAAGEHNDYTGDFTTSVFPIFTKDAVLALDSGVRLQTEADIARDGHFAYVRKTCGAGVKRAAAAIEVKTPV